LEEAADIAEKLAPELGAKSLDEARKKCEHAAVLKRVLNCSPA